MTTPDVISLGNMLVEIMRIDIDQPLDQPGTFVGPFPSGDTPIYIDTIARLGHSAGFLGAVGQDDFGICLLERFRRDGVDSSRVKTLKNQTTGVAFVAYFGDGSRKFIFHMRYSAAGHLAPDYLDKEYFQQTKWLHLTGCNLAMSDTSREACYLALELVPQDAIVSFDPNIRPELLTVEEIRDLCQPVINKAVVILPSIGEAAMLTGEEDDTSGCLNWSRQGKLIVLKRGSEGCQIYRDGDIIDVPGFQVVEVDPTGAGDSFSAGITVALLEGMDLLEAGRFANAVGALAVTKQGPMEGAPTREEVVQFIKDKEDSYS